MKTKFDIQGMSCSGCAAHVEREVKNLQGVQKVNVNLLSNNMVVEYNKKVIKDEDIIKAVQGAGYGANIASEKNQAKTQEEKQIKNETEIKSMKKRFIISIIFLIPLMFVSMQHMLHIGNRIAIVEFIFLLPIVIVNRNYFINGFKRLLKKAPNMDSLIAIGSTASIIYGHFESAGMILTLITLGKYLETKSKGKTSEAISKLIKLVPKTAIIIKDGKEFETNVEDIKIGDIVIIKPGGSIPIDGKVLEGNSSVDESSITGESIPVEKTVGDSVISGTINKNGYLKIKATKVGNDTTLAQIIKLLEEASNSKAPISKLADKVSGIFVPVVIGIAIFATLFWILQGQTLEFAISIGIAVLVISCPCALGLATPVAIMVGTGKGAQNGILIKSAESLEMLHNIDIVVLDKTGTITRGKPKVTNINSNIPEIELLKIAGGLERSSEHPLAEAIMEKVTQEKIELPEITEFVSIQGRGVKGKINGITYLGGNIAFMKENNVELDTNNELLKQGKTVLYFAKEQKYIGSIAVADTIKETSYKAIEELKRKNIEIYMITGDNKVVAQTIGKDLGIENVISEVLPQDKEKEVSKLQKQGKRVAFVGDGINDSPALVKADIGIAIGSGTDIAIESADIVLMKNNLLEVITAIDLSKAVIKNIKMNLFWAFFYNIIGIPIAAGVFYLTLGWKLNPMISAGAMSLSSVCVVTNALRLRKFKSKM